MSVSGERYKMVTKESKKLLSGEFGQTVKPFDKEVQKKCIGDTKPITCRPADLIKPQLADIREGDGSVTSMQERMCFLSTVPSGCYRVLQVP